MEELDIAIIGAGVAGLTAAYRLDGTRVAVFEAGSEVGGRTKTIDLGGLRTYTGAAVVYMGTETQKLCDELGIVYHPVAPLTYSCHHRGVTVIARTDGELVAGLPLDPDDKTELLAVVSRIRAEYDQYSGAGLSARSDRLATISFQDYIGELRPAVADFLGKLVFCHCMVRADELSAKYALRYLSSKLVLDGTHMSFIPDGMQEIAFALAARIRSPIHLRHEVLCVTPAAGGYEIAMRTPEGPRSIVAEQVILAVPGPEVARLASWLPGWKQGALKRIESVSALILNVALAPKPEASWRDVFFMPTLDCAFDYLCNCRVGPVLAKDVTVWQIGLWRERAREAMALSDGEIVEAWLEQLRRIFPDTEGAVLATHVQRWPAGFAIAKSDRAGLVADARGAVGGLHFAGDYASDSAGTHGAIESALRAAAQAAGGRS